MNKENLERLIKKIEKVGYCTTTKHFDDWGNPLSMAGHACDLDGWKMRKDVIWYYSGLVVEKRTDGYKREEDFAVNIAKSYLGLDKDDAALLFKTFPSEMKDDSPNTSEIISTLKHILDTGKVEWQIQEKT